MKKFFGLGFAVLCLSCLVAFSGCANMHKAPPVEQPKVEEPAASPDMSCYGGGEAKSDCQCAHCNCSDDCHHACKSGKPCGCDCGMHDKNAKHCMDNACDCAAAPGKCENAGCTHCMKHKVKQ